jgi:hypothetical protein
VGVGGGVVCDGEWRLVSKLLYAVFKWKDNGGLLLSQKWRSRSENNINKRYSVH